MRDIILYQDIRSEVEVACFGVTAKLQDIVLE